MLIDFLQGMAARDFSSSSGYKQMVTKPTHTDGKLVDLLLTDDPDVVGALVDSPVGAYDESAIS